MRDLLHRSTSAVVIARVGPVGESRLGGFGAQALASVAVLDAARQGLSACGVALRVHDEQLRAALDEVAGDHDAWTVGLVNDAFKRRSGEKLLPFDLDFAGIALDSHDGIEVTSTRSSPNGADAQGLAAIIRGNRATIADGFTAAGVSAATVESLKVEENGQTLRIRLHIQETDVPKMVMAATQLRRRVNAPRPAAEGSGR